MNIKMKRSNPKEKEEYNYNSVNVTIVFQVVNSREQVTLSTTLSRLR